MLQEKYPQLSKNEPCESMKFLVSQSWKEKHSGREEFFDFGFKTKAVLAGIGAPTHVFLPDVAKALSAKCVIPEHAEVANAVGAVIADITAKVSIEVSPNYKPEGITGYTVYTPGEALVFAELDEAKKAAEREAKVQAKKEARARGALGELHVEISMSENSGLSNDGSSVDLGTTVHATATGRIGL